MLGGGAIAVAVGLAAGSGLPDAGELVVLVGLLALHVAASRIEFEIGPGATVPTTLVLMPMLLHLPPLLVPLLVVASLLVSGLVDRWRSGRYAERQLVLAASAWHALGLTLVLALAGDPPPSLAHVPLCVGALAAQLALDLVSSVGRNVLGIGVPLGEMLRALRLTFLIDLLIAPLGLAVALAADGASAVLLLAFPVALLALLARDRERQVDRAVELGDAVREQAAVARGDALTGSRTGASRGTRPWPPPRSAASRSASWSSTSTA